MSQPDCTFCRIVRHDLPAAVLYEDADVVALLDRYPATPGHMLVLPKAHIEDIFTLSSDLGSNIMRVAIALAHAMRRQLSPAGVNLIQANGVAAGQTIPHFHLHLVPRNPDDSVTLQFGHGGQPADSGDLERLAALIRSGLPLRM